MKDSGIGGQAVIEGVMMKNQSKCAVAVRKPDGDIEVLKQKCSNLRERSKIGRIPVIRGIVSFVESLVLGMNGLNYSASFYEEEEEKEEKQKREKKEKKDNKEKKAQGSDKGDGIWMGLVMILAVILAIGIFVILPFFVSESLRHTVRSVQLRGLIEGVIRVVLFLAYVKVISLTKDIKRVFMYHGAEHKSINCIENGMELTVENVKKQSTAHKRCGTSFLLIVMFLSILFFMFITVKNMWLRMVLRILLIPFIAGVSYECIRFAGKHDNRVVNVLSKPGLWLQSLTTAEPDEDMIEVAIASVESVFDWKSFVREIGEPEKPSKKKSSKGKLVKEKPAKEKPAKEEDIEILDIEEEDDEILSALDRYFEAPKSQENQDGESEE